MKSKPVYGRNGSRVVLNTTVGEHVIAVATDIGWAKIICDDLNRNAVPTQEGKIS